jgi:hypothetical protein
VCSSDAFHRADIVVHEGKEGFGRRYCSCMVRFLATLGFRFAVRFGFLGRKGVWAVG